ncbi:helix-turn-helix domain-containing protein [Aquimarina rhabdastrellae]
MVEHFKAEINKVYFIENYTLIAIRSGSGAIEVDFETFLDWQDKAIYLSKGQYIKFLSDDFDVMRIEFPSEELFKSNDFRVLFKHLISLGYINFDECEKCKQYLSNSVFSNDVSSIIDISTDQWYWQNPFQAKKEEYQIIFDIKDIIDVEYRNNINSDKLVTAIQNSGYNINHLIKNKLGITINTMIQRKKLVESKKDIAFTDKSIKEIAYDKGYKDPAYFNRVFKNKIGVTPNEFRTSFDYKNRDVFMQNIIELLHLYHKQEHSLGFYADKMNMSVKALSKKVRQKINIPLGQLIRTELINSAKESLNKNVSIHEIAHELGFEEPNHFSSFFKHQVGVTPTEYILKKYNR